MQVTLQVVTPNAEAEIVEIARVSSSRSDKTEDPAKLLNYLIKNKHWSPFEHGFMTLKIVTSKAIGIQLLRHRSFTFQEFSQRYQKVTAMEPIDLRRQATDNRQSSTAFIGDLKISTEGMESELTISELVDKHIKDTQEFYNLLLENGVARECARMVLPMATETTIFMSGPVRSWVHLIQLRDDGHAQLEAQLIAKEMKKIFNEQFPNIARALEWAK